jgi:methylmalonyl-CoA/ethylmalonyl-CoA epimerase
MRIKRIHRITLAVRDVDAARATFERLFGAEAAAGATQVPAFGIRALDLRIGDDTLQVAAPLDADNPVMRFLERKGEGFYNIALEVDDLDAAVAELGALGVRVSEPSEAEPGLRSTFVTMSATHGLSIQLVELPRAEAEPQPTIAPPVVAPEPEPQPAIAPPAEETTAAPEPVPAKQPAPVAQPAVLDLTPDEWSDID